MYPLKAFGTIILEYKTKHYSSMKNPLKGTVVATVCFSLPTKIRPLKSRDIGHGKELLAWNE